MNWYKTAQTSEHGVYSKKLDIQISDPLMIVLKYIQSQGYESLIVGGSVRDAFISEIQKEKIKIKDIDIEVYGEGEDPSKSLLNIIEEASEKLKEISPELKTRASIEGEAFAVIKFSIKHPEGIIEDYDFSIPRRDSKKENGGGHKSFDIQTDKSMSKKEAASRRDFTVNALAYDPIKHQVHDYFGGVNDIYEKKLKATSTAFAEDPLRVLRGLNFSCRFGFNLDEDTAKVCRECLKEAGTISTERIGGEWLKAFVKGKYPGNALKFLIDSGWVELYPEIQAMIGIDQEAEWHPEGNLIEHITQSLNNASKVSQREGLDDRNKVILLLSSLCHDLGKSAPGVTRKEMKGGAERITSPGHDIAGIDLTKSLIDKMGIERVLGKGIINEVVPLVQYHMVHIDQYKPESAKQNIRQIADSVYPSNINMLTLLMEVDHASREAEYSENFQPTSPENVQKMREDAKVNGVLDGKLVGYYGQKVGPIIDFLKHSNPKEKAKLGPFIGEIQRRIRDEQLKGIHSKIQTEEDAIAFAQQLAADLVISKWIDTKTDIIDMLGVSGSPVGEILKALKQAYVNDEIFSRDDAIRWLNNNYSQPKEESEPGTIAFSGEKMLKFSEHNSNYIPTKSTEEIVYEQLKSGCPDRKLIASLFHHEETDHVDNIFNFFESEPNECVQTYKEILEEALTNEVNAYLKKMVKTAQKYDDNFDIDLNDPFSDLRESIGNDVVDYSLDLIESIESEALSRIVYVGILDEGEELGLFSPDFDKKVKNIYYSVINPNISEKEIIQKQQERQGISLLINTQNIKETAYELLPNSYDQEDEMQMTSLVLAEILTHEAVHASGIDGEKPSNGEEIPVEKERDFLIKAVTLVNAIRVKEGKEKFNVKLKKEN